MQSLRIALALLAFSALAFSYEPPKPAGEVSVFEAVWHDAGRDRDVPVKIYYPAKTESLRPVILFSPGLGGTREGYEYLGRYWAGCGFVSVHLQHAGSDDAVWRDAEDRKAALQQAVTSPQNAVARLKDVSFAIDQLERLRDDAKFPPHGSLDLKHIGMSGHSFGGWTTMAIVGQTVGLRQFDESDPRITAAIQMSAPVPASAQREHVFDNITLPVFHITGTRDDSPIGDTTAAQRRMLFDQMTRADELLAIYQGADHMTFSGSRGGHTRPEDEPFLPLICASTTAFWEAYLEGKADAKAWLHDGGLKAFLGSKATLETKQPSSSPK